MRGHSDTCCNYIGTSRTLSFLHSKIRIRNTSKTIHKRNFIMIEKFNNFHLVEKSPWPILSSIGALVIILTILTNLSLTDTFSIILPIAIVIFLRILWWRDIYRESNEEGYHTKLVTTGLKYGIILFISSEILFFVSFFWAFFHRRITPTIEVGAIWPPLTINSFNPIRIPLLNTILLLSSGVSVTWAHHQILRKKLKRRIYSLLTTIFLGIVFSLFQGVEYIEAPFCISDSTFGSVFFIATGFHGLHVILGSLFLFTNLLQNSKKLNSRLHTIGFECAAWYWHFVDILWLFHP